MIKSVFADPYTCPSMSVELPRCPSGQFTFRPLPLPPPPPHACTCSRPAPYAHSTMQRNTIPVHDCSHSNQASELSTRQPDNNWVLKRNIPLEARLVLTLDQTKFHSLSKVFGILNTGWQTWTHFKFLFSSPSGKSVVLINMVPLTFCFDIQPCY